MHPHQFTAVTPPPIPQRAECVFYHTIDLPNNELIQAEWDIRGYFEDYIGHYPLRGKTVLDVGTASGFLTFAAEQAGAVVTSLDARDSTEFTRVPFEKSVYHQDRATFIEQTNDYLKMLRNSYWYCWHKLGSKAELISAPLSLLPFWERRFDVVLAGAITEHLSDPVTVIGNLAKLAKEALIIAFDPVVATDEMILTAPSTWRDPKPEHAFTWFFISRGIYSQVLNNLGFEVEFVDAHAVANFAGHTEPTRRTTVIARRRAVQG